MNRFITVVLSIWFVSVAAIASAQTLRVIADRTNVRDKASTDGAIVVAVSKGDELEVLDRSGAWYHVRVKSTGAQGYVNAAVVEVVPGGTPNAATPAPAAPPSNAPAPAAPRAATQPKASSPGSTGGDRKVFIRPFGGLWSGYSATGFGGGVGVALRPFSIPELEIEIDGAYAHQSLDAFVYLGTDYSWSANLIQGSGNVLYNFKLPNSSFTPFAGGGLQYSHETVSYPSGLPGLVFPDYGFNGIGFQVIGGVEKPINDSMAWRFQFRAGNGLMVLAGVSF